MARSIEIVVVALWLALAGHLAWQSVFPVTDAVGSGASESVLEGEEWMGIYMEGGKIGYAMSRIEEAGDGYDITEEMLASFRLQGSVQQMHTVTASKVDKNAAVREFTFRLDSGVADMTISGSVSGKTLNLEVNTAGRVQKVALPIDEAPHLSSGLGLVLLKDGLEVGKKFKVPFFDPASLSKQFIEMEVEGREELKSGGTLADVYRIRQNYSGVTSTVWFSPEHGTVKGEGPMGFTFLRETKQQAMSMPPEGYAAADIIALTSVPASGGPKFPRRTGFMRARLSGAELEGLDIDGGRQSFDDGVVTIKMEDTGKPIAYPVKAEGSNLERYLEPSPMVQSDDPKIARKAKEVAGGSADVLGASAAISDWLYSSIKKQPVAGIPSAVEVLENLTGDCNEHTVLFTAMARSLGIPARMAAGIVMLDGAFYYHAWPEVYAGQWVAVDPTFGQLPADATHIRLVEGSLERQVALMKLVGNIRVEVMEYR